jgi:hypothetical protein
VPSRDAGTLRQIISEYLSAGWKHYYRPLLGEL